MNHSARVGQGRHVYATRSISPDLLAGSNSQEYELDDIPDRRRGRKSSSCIENKKSARWLIFFYFFFFVLGAPCVLTSGRSNHTRSRSTRYASSYLAMDSFFFIFCLFIYLCIYLSDTYLCLFVCQSHRRQF
ncbi:hypothetical protein GGR50DRAFT_681839 [Xylaria sp. CBS 124048]|nr:hypothetical protein GGR50DRAFT_681839 [Xylaria sp. CBS 124048]